MEKIYNPGSGTDAIKLAYLILEQIEIDTEIGVDPQEQGRVQRIRIDVSVGIDDAKTRIPDTKEGLVNGLDYSKIRTCVLEAAKLRTYLLETFANKIAQSILLLPGALTCSVKVTKLRCWANVDKTSVLIFREK